MEIRKMLILVFLLFVLGGCIAPTPPVEISSAEISATQAAIKRQDLLAQKTHEVQMALVWPKMIALSFILPIVTLGSLMILKKIVDQWIVEREIRLQDNLANLKLKQTEVTKVEKQKQKIIPVNNQNTLINQNKDYKDIADKAEEKLMNQL